MPPPRQRPASGKPSSNPVWRQLEEWAIRYRALPADDPRHDAERKALHQAIYRQMAGTLVYCLVDESADSNGAVAAPDDGTSPPAAPGQATTVLRHDSPLEAVFRAEADRLARQHGDGLASAYGGPTNLAAEAQQRLVTERSLNRPTTLISQWQPDRASLYTFISRKAASFLIDMARQQFGRGGGKPQAAALGTAGHDSMTAEGDGDWSAYGGLPVDDDDALGRVERQLALHQAINQLPDDWRVVALVVLTQQEDDELGDVEAARQAGLKRETYRRRKAEVMARLRRLLQPHASPP